MCRWCASLQLLLEGGDLEGSQITGMEYLYCELTVPRIRSRHLVVARKQLIATLLIGSLISSRVGFQDSEAPSGTRIPSFLLALTRRGRLSRLL